MSIQSLDGNNQNKNSALTDFQTFRKNVKDLQTALDSGDEDQVTLSENALSQSLNQLQSDSSNTAGPSGSAYGPNATDNSAVNNTVSYLVSMLSRVYQNDGSNVSVNGSNTSSSGDGITITSLMSMLSGLSGATASALVSDPAEEQLQGNGNNVNLTL